MKKTFQIALLVLLSFLPVAAHAQRFTGPWDLEALRKPPFAQWGQASNLVQEAYYEGEPFQGKATRIFAYYARPENGDGPFPGMVLVHGGGGKAFAKWAGHWAQRGYAALAMDLAGNGPDGHRLPDGGPDQSDFILLRHERRASESLGELFRSFEISGWRRVSDTFSERFE